MPTEQLVYETLPYAESHPAFLEALGILFGLTPQPHQHCRVLELGCGTGGNLIPQAFYLPDSQFVGIDLSSENIQFGKRLIQNAALENIDLIQGNILELDASLGSFDYIIAHGVFSWVPEDVRQHLLSLFRALLAPNGIGYISFNCKPGWSRRGILRDILLEATGRYQTDAERLDAANETLNRLDVGYSASTDPFAEYLKHEIQHIRQSHPSYILQEYLNPHNHAVFLREFVDAINEHGLQYLCDSALNSGSPEAFNAAFEDATLGIEAPNELEQWLDFLRLREFRQALVVHESAEIESEVDLDVFCGMGLVLDASSTGTTEKNEEDASNAPIAKIISGLSHPLSKMAVERLASQFPNAVSLNSLINSIDVAPPDEAFYGEMFGLLMEEKLALRPTDITFRKPDLIRPTASALARQQVELGWGHITTLHHALLTVDDFAAKVISLCNGRNTVAHIAAEMVSVSASESHSKNQAAITANVGRLIQMFARHGIFV